jgi:glutathione S-transferase
MRPAFSPAPALAQFIIIEDRTVSLTLYLHPLSSYCHKVLIALYEAGIDFEAQIVDLQQAASREQFQQVWPMGQFPVLRDQVRAVTLPESSIIIEHLAQHFPSAAALLPSTPELALQTRLRDRLFDLHIHQHMQKIITDPLRPPGHNDPFGVEQASARLRTACELLDRDMASRTWANGAQFSMADCSAAPALFYANRVHSLAQHPHVAAYLERLMARPSYARVLAEAQPYFAMLPK